MSKQAVYKLTGQDGHTLGMQWNIGVTHRVNVPGTALCTNQVIHVYTHPYFALFFNPIHANYQPCRLWKGVGTIVADDGMKAGVKSLTIVEELPLPDFSLVQKIALGILCAKTVWSNEHFLMWADEWLSGKNRSVSVPNAAYAAAHIAAAYAADAATAYAAADAAADAADIVAAIADAVYAAAGAARTAAVEEDLDMLALLTQCLAVV